MTTNIRHKTLKVKTFLGKAIDKKRNAVIPRPHYTLYIIHYTLYIVNYLKVLLSPSSVVLPSRWCSLVR